MDNTRDLNTRVWLEAIRTRSYDNARQLLRSDQDINVRGVGGITALHVVAKDGALKKMQKLLAGGADLRATNDDGMTPLQVAQLHGHTEIVVHLLEREALVRVLTTQLGHTPKRNDIHSAQHNKKTRAVRNAVHDRLESKSRELVQAARVGDLATVQSILEAEDAISVDAVDQSTGETAFSAAFTSGHTHVYTYLLGNGAHMYAPCFVAGRLCSTLVAAVAIGDVALVVAHGTRLTSPHLDHTTCALAEAATAGSIGTVDELLALHVPFEIPDRSWLAVPWLQYDKLGFESLSTAWRLLSFACYQQDLQLVQHLLTTHSEIKNRASMATHGALALFLAVYRENEAIVDALLDSGASLRQSFGSGLTAMAAAVLADSVRMLGFLLARGGRANVLHGHISGYTQEYNESLLTTALYTGAMECAHVLLPLETRPEHRDQALLHAARRNDLDFVYLLLMESALPTATPSTERAFSCCVAQTICPLMLDLLLTWCCGTQGYAIDIVNKWFVYACQSQTADVVSVFLAHGMDINVDCERQFDAPLISACLLSYGVDGVRVVKLLLENGVDWLSLNENGDVPVAVVAARCALAQDTDSKAYLETTRDLLLTMR